MQHQHVYTCHALLTGQQDIFGCRKQTKIIQKFRRAGCNAFILVFKISDAIDISNVMGIRFFEKKNTFFSTNFKHLNAYTFPKWEIFFHVRDDVDVPGQCSEQMHQLDQK